MIKINEEVADKNTCNGKMESIESKTEFAPVTRKQPKCNQSGENFNERISPGDSCSTKAALSPQE